MAQRSTRAVESIGAVSTSIVAEPFPVPQVPGAAEAFFNDFRAAMHDYPEQFITLEIVDVDVPGDALNTNGVETAEVSATITLKDGTKSEHDIPLRKEGGAWKICGNPY